MTATSGLVGYYSARAAEYEAVYRKPEREDDLWRLRKIVPEFLTGCRVLEVACGTGYWTRTFSGHAATVTGCDLSEEMLAIARARQPSNDAATFCLADAYDLASVPGSFDAAFIGFWWSHVPRRDVPRFLVGLHGRVEAYSRIMVLDNRYVEGSNTPIARTDDDGNTYQRRTLADGSRHDVLKNFPSPAEVCAAIDSAGGHDVTVTELPHYWYATYRVSDGRDG